MRPRLPARRSEHDRDIVRLAVPAFGALIAEPLYLLADTAIVGNLGVRPLGGLAVAGIVLTAVFGIFNFLAYSTTGAVARQLGAGNTRAAAEQGIDGIWLAAGLGIVLTVAGILLAPVIVDVMGASASVRPFALTYLRISLLGAPFVLVALAGAGYLRGMQDTKTTLVIALAANTVNLALELFLVYGLDRGIAGSAWGTVAAQVLAALAFLVIVRRSARRAGAQIRPRGEGVKATAVVGSHLIVRTGSLLLALLLTTAVAARISDVAGRRAPDRVPDLDVPRARPRRDRDRRAGARRQAPRARTTKPAPGPHPVGCSSSASAPASSSVSSPRCCAPCWSPSSPTARRSTLLAEQVLWFVAALQPVAGAVFVLDGILIGAGDSRYLALAMAGATLLYLPAVGLVVATNGGLLMLWAAFSLWVVARLVGMGARFTTDRWLVTGAVRG